MKLVALSPFGTRTQLQPLCFRYLHDYRYWYQITNRYERFPVHAPQTIQTFAYK